MDKIEIILISLFIIFVFGFIFEAHYEVTAPCNELQYLSLKDLPVRCLPQSLKQ